MTEPDSRMLSTTDTLIDHLGIQMLEVSGTRVVAKRVGQAVLTFSAVTMPLKNSSSPMSPRASGDPVRWSTSHATDTNCMFWPSTDGNCPSQ